MNPHKQNNFRRWWDSLSIMDRIIADEFAYLVWVCILFLAYFFLTDAFYLVGNAWWLILLGWLFVFVIEINDDPYKYAWTFKEREEWDKQHPAQRGSVIIHGRKSKG